MRRDKRKMARVSRDFFPLINYLDIITKRAKAEGLITYFSR